MLIFQSVVDQNTIHYELWSERKWHHRSTRLIRRLFNFTLSHRKQSTVFRVRDVSIISEMFQPPLYSHSLLSIGEITANPSE